MRKFTVTGMSCAACSARVEKAVRSVPGVSSCSVSLLTNSMGVEGTADDKSIISAVEAAGYGAYSGDGAAKPAEETEENEYSRLKRRLFVSLGFLLVLMYVSMGHNMLSLPLPLFLSDPLGNSLAQLLLAATVMLINKRFFTSGFRAIRKGAPNMDTLVALGSAAGFVYSICSMFSMSSAAYAGDMASAAAWAGELYFDSSAMILALITIGKTLENRAKGKTVDALKGLMKLTPDTAVVLINGERTEVPVSALVPGNEFVVLPGASIPADGTVVSGNAAVDESALTGESIPVDKNPGDTVSAGTVNKDGFMVCRAQSTGSDTALARIIELVRDSSATKAPIARLADKVAGVFVPVVIAIAAVTVAVWLILGESAGFAIARGISVLVISCPCSMGLATPVAIMVGSGIGAKHGILFKTAAALEQAGRIETVALDKTGTVTSGVPEVTDIIPVPGQEEEKFLEIAASLETLSEHPLASAINRYSERNGTTVHRVDNFKAVPGGGLCGTLDGEDVFGGSVKFASQHANPGAEILRKAEELSEQGKTPLLFGRGKEITGIIAVADSIRPESSDAVAQLHGMGIRTVMLTGDNRNTAAAVASQAGIDEVFSEILPDEKTRVVRNLSQNGKTAMTGDGINDAPALTAADLGIAIGTGTDIAIDSAELVIMNSRLTDLTAAIRLGRATLRNIRENLFWAFFYNSLGIPIAAGVLIPAGITLNPMIAAAAMSLSSICVVSNALRLNTVDIYSPKHDRIKKKRTIKEKENIPMTRTMKIDGMMCPHCEARVKKTLEAIEGVASAQVSYTAGTAVVELSVPVADDTLRDAVSGQGYDVLGIE